MTTGEHDVTRSTSEALPHPPTQAPAHPPVHPPDPASILAPDTSTGRAAYNLVTDTVGGVNVRWRDNRFQAIVIGVAMVVCAAGGALLPTILGDSSMPRVAGAVIGAIVGMVLGLFGSGIYLMVYRAVRHMSGRHD